VVKLLTEQGYRITQAARNLGIDEEAYFIAMNTHIGKFLFYSVRAMRLENVHKCHNEIKLLEKLKTNEIIKYQSKKIKNILSYNADIPFLKNLISSRKLDSKKINIKNDLNLFPILNKQFLNDNFNDFVNSKIENVSVRTTSGSTGNPFRFYRERVSLAYMDAIMYNAYSWHGIRIGDRQARFWGMPFVKSKQREAKIKDFLMNRIRLSAFQLSDQAMLNYFKRINKFRPSYVYGYPSFIYRFALFCSANKFSLRNLNLKAVIVTGEKLIPFQGEYIQNIFSTKLVQEYGCSEVGVIAFQCKQGKMHTMAPNLIVEVVKNDKSVKDELGEIVITELNARSFPFLRYKLGDVGVILSEKCPCGMEWPLLNVAEGRVDDYIVTPEGDKVYDAVLAYTLNFYQKYIISFKTTQKKNGDLYIQIKPSELYNESIEQKCLQQLKKRISQSLNIVIQCVGDIPQENSGKLRYFMSEYKI
jgi:phenylacetate-CoA ligase